ncbi:MAG: hypothetical protein ACJAYU_004711 [Bradymonadia bacterium]|jgi:hypothetical protein
MGNEEWQTTVSLDAGDRIYMVVDGFAPDDSGSGLARPDSLGLLARSTSGRRPELGAPAQILLALGSKMESGELRLGLRYLHDPLCG